jgi:cytidine deaminase
MDRATYILDDVSKKIIWSPCTQCRQRFLPLFNFTKVQTTVRQLRLDFLGCSNLCPNNFEQ